MDRHTDIQRETIIPIRLNKIHDDYFKNVTSRVLTRFSFVLPCDLVFDPE